ncbi:hypothetical protein Pst134EA_019630 [Puccinia striiformis f. sp. tritici]|uniref:hypothetical protein n=1 Tax=Puccinia striiformis f. sp. tritici TaxID=168172 RepID=UPI0020085EFC|nr:hypothetical protein Pst134EA_019630 [Puccinia striiformis f. sp. tritici]KAH9459477.1 hypothetical protein Pst134EA_019630 [Puccinia striiformis f. sp. tritici]KAI9618638.1 hypothetical protein KEM48_006617 [Puccinia striiformis f. sp. tritici PST-130]
MSSGDYPNYWKPNRVRIECRSKTFIFTLRTSGYQFNSMMIQRLGSGLGHRPLVVRPRLTILRPAKYSTLQNDGRQILGSIEGGLKSGPAEPMPEDAKGQAVSALRRIGLVLRLAFYAGLGVCVTGTIGFVGLHLWIEYLELSPPQTTTRNDQSIIKYSWEDEIKVSLICN